MKNEVLSIKKEYEEAKGTIKKLTEELLIDRLTKFPNKQALLLSLQKLKENTVIVFKMTTLKNLTRTFGIEFHDSIVLELSEKIRNDLMGKLYRIGTDTFAYHTPQALSERAANGFCKKITDFFSMNLIRFNYDDVNFEGIELSVTIGYATGEGEETLSKAILALSYASDIRKIVKYDSAMSDVSALAEKIKIIQIIGDVIKKGGVIPFFQPIYDKVGDKPVKYESLMRLLYKQEIILPGKFLEIAKDIRKYSELEKTLLSNVFSALEMSKATFSVNLSVRDMIDPYIRDYILKTIKTNGFGDRIIFEILEDENMEQIKEVSHFIDDVKELGCKIAIDDFGSGYSNFAYILNLQPDYLKVDSSIVKNIVHDAKSRIILSAIVSFASELEIKTIAEHVSDYDILQTCMELGVDEFQGFFLGKPAQFVLETCELADHNRRRHRRITSLSSPTAPCVCCGNRKAFGR